VHIIHAADEVQHLEASSKLNAEWEYLTYLFERGRGWASAWLDEHFDDLGQRQTLDLDDLFADTFKPVGAIEDVLEEGSAPPPSPKRRARRPAKARRTGE
jgi:NTE family protein